jgi:hypothetical protein
MLEFSDTVRPPATSIRKSLKSIADSARMVVIYWMADRICTLASKTTDGDLWVSGIVAIMEGEIVRVIPSSSPRR